MEVSQRPDRGWSWVVAFAACFCNLVLAGIFRTSGVLFVAFISTFGVSREEAAWPMGVCICVLNLTGPFSSILALRYGVRPVVIAGAIIGAVGVSTCYFTTSLTIITLLFGGIFGVGYGLINTLLPVIVNAYFLNLRGMANGIANSGSCFGSLILPVLFEFLIANYDLSGCFLITGGVVLNIAVAGALLRPPSSTTPRPYRWIEKGEGSASLLTPRKTSLAQNVQNFSNCSISEEGPATPDPKSDPQRHLQAELVSALNRRTACQATELTNFVEESSGSLATSSSSVFERKDSIQVQIELLRAEKEFEDTLGDFQSVGVDIVELSSKSEEILNRIDPDEVKTSDLTDSCPARHSFSVSSAKRPQNRFKSPIPSSGPLKKYSFKLRDSSRESDLYPVSETAKTPEDVIDSTRGPIPEETDGKRPVTVMGSFRTVLTSTMFYVTAVTNVTFYFIFHMYVVIVVDYVIDQGVADEDAKYVLFAFALSDLSGRLCLGWITDRKLLTRPRFVMAGMVGIGLVFFALPFATEYWSLVVVSCCYGVLLGCTMVIFPILLVDYLGYEVHAVAYGCMCFINGFTSLVRPLIIGYFRDSVGSYHNMFYILGMLSIFASALWTLDKCFQNKHHHPPSHYEPKTDKT